MIHHFEEALTYLYQRLPMFQRIGAAAYKKDLTNTLALSQALGNPHKKIKTIHVGGTNGKGSTSNMLAAILQTAGYKVGLYTSPHLKSFTERIKINGENISEQYVIDFINQYDKLLSEINPSFFEVNTIMAFDYFAKQKVDVAVIEVGLGGRLDSTNIITPDLSVITNISFDHTEFLGDTLPLIASEKAGIIKPFIPVVIGEKYLETSPVFFRKAKEQNAPIFFAQDNFNPTRLDYDVFGQLFEVIDKNKHSKLWKLDLAGEYQKENLLTVLQSVEVLQQLGYQITDQAIGDGLKRVQAITGFKGRMYVLDRFPLVVCDTGHNEAGIQAVMPQIERFCKGELHIVWGMVKEKTHEKVLRHLPKNVTYYFVCPDVPRGLPAEEMQQIAAKMGLFGQVYESVNAGLQAAKQAVTSHEDVIFVGGSTFVVAEVV